MQLNLAFLEIPTPGAIGWETLDQAPRRDALDVLTRLIAQAAQAEIDMPETSDE